MPATPLWIREQTLSAAKRILREHVNYILLNLLRPKMARLTSDMS